MPQGDESMWMLRPASEVILDAAVKNVAFLLDLRITLLEKLLSRFVDGVDIYLSVTRDASQEQYNKVTVNNTTNNNNKSIYIEPWFQVTLFKGAVTSKKQLKN